jgi:hypothetical protein
MALVTWGSNPFARRKGPDETFVETIGVQTHTVEYTAAWETWKRDCPAIGTRLPANQWLVLSERRAKKFMGKLAQVTLIYKTSPLEGGQPDSPDIPPPAELTEVGTSISVPIERHPDFDDDAKFPMAQKVFETVKDNTGATVQKFIGWKDDSLLRGKTDYYVASKTVTYLEYFKDRPAASEFPKIVAPPGYGDNNRWLRIGSEVNPSGQWFLRRDTYLFSGDWPWDNNMYEYDDAAWE